LDSAAGRRAAGRPGVPHPRGTAARSHRRAAGRLARPDRLGGPVPVLAGRCAAVRDGAQYPSRWSGHRGCYLAAGPGAARRGGPAAGRERRPAAAAALAEACPAGTGAALAVLPGAARTEPGARGRVPEPAEQPARARPRGRPVQAPAKPAPRR